MEASDTQAESTCRVCGSHDVRALDQVDYFTNYPLSICACSSCGCRFTRHDEAAHDFFHRSGAISYYADYRDFAQEATMHFAKGEIEELRRFLSSVSKYRFVIETAERLPLDARCLELGCSRGYLTSWLILRGMDVLGLDVSNEAVAAARQAFGDHFDLPDSNRAIKGGPYDLIYHVGVIGCVADPLGVTRSLLAKLKPGGQLIFNAPNLDACVIANQLWLDDAPPPDLVTLFPGGFWQRQFSDIAEVHETIVMRSPEDSFRIRLAQATGRSWQKPQPQPLASYDGRRVWLQPAGNAWRWVERVVGKAAQMTGLNKLVPTVPADFGLFVTMQRK